jgi:hypothetical protein
VWPFSTDKRARARLLEAALRPGKLGKDAREGHLEYHDIHFVMAQVFDERLEQTPILIEQVITAAVGGDKRVMHWGVLGSLVLMSANNPWWRTEDPGSVRRAAADRILSHLGRHVRVVHGSRRGLIGDVGTRSLIQMTVLIPNLGSAIDELISLEFGSFKEIA